MAQFGSKYFQIRSGEPMVVATLTSTGEFPQGAMMAQEDNAAYTPDDGTPLMKAANADDFVGHLAQRVNSTGPELINNLLGMTADEAALAGTKVNLLQIPVGGRIEVEGPPDIAYSAAQPTDLKEGYLLVTSGTGALTTTTAAKTLLGIQNGRLRVAQAGDRAEYRVEQNISSDAVDSGNVRLLIQRIQGAVMAA